ncbi:MULTISPECIES: PucR family transcriptional regulator [Bacillus cereus group]|uniref:PucR family transcriptional regulator n=1 Tax=Bacillus cereus group TaxID=86661 RepID=UPI0008FDED80|nr:MULTISPECIES: helix-turn-helix domain-containing protein [Bacillus cereus group]MDG1618521.1 helix-turn-helix domain-containing protein [Bacillus mobilis]MDX5835702.1 helix-turn-helix domain-containing protein [Bacillus cereus group sp. BfR-BA-01700]OJE42913.1 Fis family transcriptional regulator [Bacillus mobilis]HDR7244764.1 helix-turn-helix domain-containing protein [Bacillus mobilis]
MIQQLKTYYGEDIKINEAVLSEDYSWFLVEGNKVGIRKIRLHQREHQLLSSILTPIHTETFYKTEKEKSWHEALYKNNNISMLSVRFLHFFTTQSIVEREEFQDALQSMFSFTTTMIWETSQAGVLILEENITESVLQTALDTLETDFFVSLSFFVGRRYTQTAEFAYLYQWERKLFSVLSPYLSKKITYIEQLLPYQLMISLPKEERKKYTNHLLAHISNDKELIDSVKVFFQCNLNVSLAAKQLYLHRNTLQYRIDKFIEKTGINIKTFEGAVAVYMAFLSLDIS